MCDDHTPMMQKEEALSVVELPYAEPNEVSVEVTSTWAIDMLLSEQEKTALPTDILDCLSAMPFEQAQEQLAEYRAFEDKLPDVMWGSSCAITEDYTVDLPPWLEPGSAEATLWLAKADTIWKVKQKSGYIMIIRYCAICGKPECPIQPVEEKIRIEARD